MSMPWHDKAVRERVHLCCQLHGVMSAFSSQPLNYEFAQLCGYFRHPPQEVIHRQSHPREVPRWIANHNACSLRPSMSITRPLRSYDVLSKVTVSRDKKPTLQRGYLPPSHVPCLLIGTTSNAKMIRIKVGKMHMSIFCLNLTVHSSPNIHSGSTRAYVRQPSYKASLSVINRFGWVSG